MSDHHAQQNGNKEPTSVQEMCVEAQNNEKSSNAQNGKLYLCTSVALIAALSMGYSLGYSSPGLPSMAKTGIITTEDEYSWFGSLLTIGAILGGPIAGFLLDKVGRKLTLMLCSVPYAAGWIALATVKNIPGLYIGRILTGVAAGMTTLATPVYIAEMASPNLRGRLGSSFQLVITIGVLVAYALGIPLSYKYLALVGAAFAFILISAMTFMRDTPRHLLIQHKRDKALRVLKWVRGPKVDVDVECTEIEYGLNNQERFAIKEFLKPSLYKPLSISCVLMFFQQCSGINAVMFYTAEIFQTAAPAIDPNISTVIIGAVQVLATLVASLLMDNAGRRVLLITAGVAMTVSSTTFGLYYELTDKSPHNPNSSMLFEFADVATTAAPSSEYNWLSLTSMVVYIIGYSIGWGPIPWLIMSEIFPSKARGAASSIATALNWLVSFAVTKSFFVLKEERVLGPDGVFWFFAAVCAVGVIFVAIFVPETKGLALEEIEAKFSGRNRNDREIPELYWINIGEVPQNGD